MFSKHINRAAILYWKIFRPYPFTLYEPVIEGGIVKSLKWNDNKWIQTGWLGMVAIVNAIVFGLLFRFIWILKTSNLNNGFEVIDILTHCFMTVIIVFFDVFVVSVFWKPQYPTLPLQEMDHKLKVCFGELEAVKESEAGIIEKMLYLIIPVILFGVIITSIGSIFHPYSPIYPVIKEFPLGIKLIGVLALFVGAYLIAGLFIFLMMSALMYIQTTKGWLNYINHTAPIILEKLQARVENETPKKILERQLKIRHLYHWIRQTQIMLQLTNNMINDYAILAAPALYGFGFVLAVIMNYAIMTTYDVVGMPTYLLWPTILVVILMLAICLIPEGAEMNEMSLEFKHVWQEKGNKAMRSFCRGCKPIKMDVGPFFYLQRSTTFTFLALIVDYSVDVLLTTGGI